uniref:Sleeping Beauty transposase HTH domain-containing protein n=1 Tax=Gasterosteus aculeatus aculeatus TaxID=481459 RepID=A0AAQ4PBH1_GASAC
MGKSKELSMDLKKRIIDLNKSGKSLGAISKQLHVPRATVQTIVCEYKVHGTVLSLPRSGRKRKLSPAAERKLVRRVKSQPRTTKKQIGQELEAAGRQMSVCTVKHV